MAVNVSVIEISPFESLIFLNLIYFAQAARIKSKKGLYFLHVSVCSTLKYGSDIDVKHYTSEYIECTVKSLCTFHWEGTLSRNGHWKWRRFLGPTIPSWILAHSVNHAATTATCSAESLGPIPANTKTGTSGISKLFHLPGTFGPCFLCCLDKLLDLSAFLEPWESVTSRSMSDWKSWMSSEKLQMVFIVSKSSKILQIITSYVIAIISLIFHHRLCKLDFKVTEMIEPGVQLRSYVHIRVLIIHFISLVSIAV